MAHISITPQRRRYRAFDALDELVARECEAIRVRPGPTAPPPSVPGEDTRFVEGAAAYLAERSNAAELIAAIDQRWKALKATAEESTADRDDGDAPQAGPDGSDGEPGAEPRADASRDTGPEPAP